MNTFGKRRVQLVCRMNGWLLHQVSMCDHYVSPCVHFPHFITTSNTCMWILSGGFVGVSPSKILLICRLISLREASVRGPIVSYQVIKYLYTAFLIDSRCFT